MHARLLRSLTAAVVSVVVAGAVVACSDTPDARPARRAPLARVDLLTSSADGSTRVVPNAIDARAGTGSGPLVTVAIDEPRQRWRGVGAALTESSAYVLAEMPPDRRAHLLREVFAPERGGLSVVRLTVGASDFSLEHRSLAESPTPDPGLATFSIERDRRWVIPVLREILEVRPDLTIVASPWSAPGWMKNTGNFLAGALEPVYEDAFVDYLVKFVEAYRAEGIDVGWLTVQNEPASFKTDYPSMVMVPEQQARIVTALAAALGRAGLATRLLAYDHNWCDAQPPGPCVGDGPTTFPAALLERVGSSAPLAGIGLHCYGGDHVEANEAMRRLDPSLEVWLTECSGGAWQPTRDSAFAETAQLLVDDLAHWSSATLLWNLALDPASGPHLGGCGDCRPVVTVDASAPGGYRAEVELDVLATVSRFAPPGSGALVARSSAADLTVAGVCSPDRRPAAIVWNAGAAASASVAFGDERVRVPLAARSLVAVRAPAGVDCELAPSADDALDGGPS